MHDDTGGQYRFISQPLFVNQRSCLRGAVPNPYTSYWIFNYPTPPKNTWFDVWLSVYWNCNPKNYGDEEFYCNSEDNIHHRDYVK